METAVAGDCEGLDEKSDLCESLAVDSCWYAVFTRSRQEKVVHQVLSEKKGVESFLPLRGIVSQWADRRKLVQKPLFPGYLFARFVRNQLHLVTAVSGVARILGNGNGPIPVPDEQVNTVRRIVEAPFPVMPWPLLQTGNRVRVIAGPLMGLETFIVERRGSLKCSLIISVDILGQSAAVEIDPQCVEPIS